MLLASVVQEGIAAVPCAIDRTGLLFRHVLDSDWVRTRVSGQAERGHAVGKTMADIVMGVDDGEGTLGEGARVLDRNQNAVEDPTGGQSPAAEIIAFAASGQNHESETS